MAELVAACVFHELRPDVGSVGVTAIDKRPVSGRVRTFGLHTDVQASRKHHGGELQAINVCAQENADYWENELGRPLDAGSFGETLRVSGLDVSGTRVGERWVIGPTVIVKVTSPREPCATFATRVGGPDERGWVKRFAAARRTGLYVRVVKTGEIVAGDTIEVIEVPADAPTITEVFVGTASPIA